MTRAWLLLAMLALGCEDPAPGAPAELAGTWETADGQRVYGLSADGTFELELAERGPCPDGTGEARPRVDIAGRWERRGELLVLDVQRSSDSMFEGSSMRDTVVSLEGSELVLDSSIVDCEPGPLRLSKRGASP